MDAAVSHVELELGRGLAYPFGDRDHAYHLYLPLMPDGRLDLSRLRRGDGHYGVRQRLPGRPEACGMVRLDADGRLVFEFDERPRNRQLGFQTPPDRFVVGRVVAIEEDDGQSRPFQVIAIRREGGVPPA